MKPDNELANTIVQKKQNGSLILINLLPLLSVAIIVLLGMINDNDIIGIMKVSIMAFLLSTAMVFFVRMQEAILNAKYSKIIVLMIYLLSILLVILPKDSVTYSFWMIGGLLTAMVVERKLGLIVYFNLTFILSIANSLRPEATIHFLIMGFLFALLSEALKSKSTVIYAAIILLSTNITLAFVMNNFIFETDSNVNYMASLLSLLIVIIASFILSMLYDRLIGKHLVDSEVMNITIEEEPSIPDRSLRTSYDLLLSENNELITKMKEHSEGLYKHSMLIGDLSGRAAGIIGADEELARAGGYYYEVGKIRGKDYIHEGLKLADEYDFPDDLKKILKQHSIKYDKPTFIESAIVMLSDNVASTIDYIVKSGHQKFTTEKIIDNIFNMRMDKGTFDESGLSVKEFKLLKDFYQKEFKSKDDGKGMEEENN